MHPLLLIAAKQGIALGATSYQHYTFVNRLLTVQPVNQALQELIGYVRQQDERGYLSLRLLLMGMTRIEQRPEKRQILEVLVRCANEARSQQ